MCSKVKPMFLNEVPIPMHRWRSNQKGKVNHLRSNNIRQFGSIVAQFESSNQITQIMLFLYFMEFYGIFY